MLILYIILAAFLIGGSLVVASHLAQTKTKRLY